MDKAELLARVLQARDRGLTLIFTRTKRTAAKVADDLATRGFAAAAVHGDLGQGAREQALRAFRSGKVDVLVATDVAARGWDVEGISHVVNYQAPEDEMIYVHRIGRTARAGKPGKAITLVDWDDVPRWKLICDSWTCRCTSRPRPTPTSAASLPRAGHPGGCDRRAAARRAHPRGAWPPNSSRISAGRIPGRVETAAATGTAGPRDVLEPAESAAARAVTAGRRAAAGRTASREPGAIGAHANAPDVVRHRAARTPQPRRPAGRRAAPPAKRARLGA